MLAEGKHRTAPSNTPSAHSTASHSKGVMLPSMGIITKHQWVSFLQIEVVASTADQEKLSQHDGEFVKNRHDHVYDLIENV